MCDQATERKAGRVDDEESRLLPVQRAAFVQEPYRLSYGSPR